MTDWDSMGHGIKKSRGWAFQAISVAFQTLDRVFGFLLTLQKLDWVSEKLDPMFWNKESDTRNTSFQMIWK